MDMIQGYFLPRPHKKYNPYLDKEVYPQLSQDFFEDVEGFGGLFEVHPAEAEAGGIQGGFSAIVNEAVGEDDALGFHALGECWQLIGGVEFRPDGKAAIGDAEVDDVCEAFFEIVAEEVNKLVLKKS